MKPVQVLNENVSVVVSVPASASDGTNVASLLMVEKSKIDLSVLTTVANSPQADSVAAQQEAAGGNPDSVQTVSEAVAYFKNILAEQAASDDSQPMGVNAAMLAIVNWLDSINQLQTASANEATKLAQTLEDVSDQENAVLSQDSANINNTHGLTGQDLTNYLTEQTNIYNTDETTFNNSISTVQGLSESAQSLVSDLAKTTTNDYTTLQSILQLWSNLASDLR